MKPIRCKPDCWVCVHPHYHCAAAHPAILLLRLALLFQCGLYAMYRGLLEEAEDTVEHTAGHLPYTSQPSFHAIQMLLTQAQLHRVSHSWGSLSIVINEMKQVTALCYWRESIIFMSCDFHLKDEQNILVHHCLCHIGVRNVSAHHSVCPVLVWK